MGPGSKAAGVWERHGALPEGLSRTAASALELTFKRSVEDALTLSLFEGVEVDGRAAPERGASGAPNYTADRGSLALRLQPAFPESLAAGEHRMKAFFRDGDALVTFVVRAAEERDDEKASDGQKGGDEAARDGTGGQVVTSGRPVARARNAVRDIPRDGDALAAR